MKIYSKGEKYEEKEESKDSEGSKEVRKKYRKIEYNNEVKTVKSKARNKQNYEIKNNKLTKNGIQNMLHFC